LLILTTIACSGATEASGRVVLLYGDSLLYEASSTVEASVPRGIELLTRAVPGSAPCDWWQQLDRDLDRGDISLVVLESAGNAWTECMTERGRLLDIGSSGYFERYRRDLTATFERLEGREVAVAIVAPPPVEAPFGATLQRVWMLTRQAAADHLGEHIVYETPARAVADDAGGFAARLPCLPDEREREVCDPDGLIRVREPAGLHFCPSGYAPQDDMLAGCSTYSSGAVRFGRALAEEVVRTLERPGS
jgi:hypothetical protein